MPKCVRTPHSVSDKWRSNYRHTIQRSELSAPTGTQPYQVPDRFRNWRNKTLPSMPHYKRLYKSSWKKNFNARKMIEAGFFPIYVLSNCLSRWGVGAIAGLDLQLSEPRWSCQPQQKKCLFQNLSSSPPLWLRVKAVKSNRSCRKPRLLHCPRINQKLLIARS